MLYRFTLDCAIPKTVYEGLTNAQKVAIRDRIRELKALAVRINAGLPNEEASIKATWHICRHDEGLPCEAEQDI